MAHRMRVTTGLSPDNGAHGRQRCPELLVLDVSDHPRPGDQE